jgi:hypothetical protein
VLQAQVFALNRLQFVGELAQTWFDEEATAKQRDSEVVEFRGRGEAQVGSQGSCGRGSPKGPGGLLGLPRLCSLVQLQPHLPFAAPSETS